MFVIKAQLDILDQVRKGVTLNILEGKPLDQIPEKPGWAPVGTTVEQANE